MDRRATDTNALDGFEETHLGMTNFDHTIDAEFATVLQAAPARVYGRHAAYNFNGLVWFEDGLFHEQVWQFRSPRQIFSALTLQELMNAVNAAWGSG